MGTEQTGDDGNKISGSIVGLFDTITGITKEVGGLFGQFEDGFTKIKPENTSDVEIFNTTTGDVNKTESHGSNLVVGLFDTLKDLTKDVGKLVGGVQAELSNRRPEVVKLAGHVEEEVQSLGSALKSWVNSLEKGERNITWSLNHTLPDGNIVQVSNFTSWVKISDVEQEEDGEILVEDIPVIE